jgi:hypothetical protein
MSQPELLFPQNRLDAGHVLAQSVNLVQALGLTHLELKLHAKELIIQLALLMGQLNIG